MNKNKKNILLLSTLSGVTCLGVALGLAFNNVFKTAAAETVHEIKFSSTKNKLTGSSTHVYTEEHSDYVMEQEGLTTGSSDNWASFDTNATFWIGEKIGEEYTKDNGFNGMKTLQINFADEGKDFRIYFSKDGNFNTNYSRKYTSKTSMTIDFEGHPHYFKFEALDPNTILSMTITHSCDDEEDRTWNLSHGVTYNVIGPTTATYGLYPQTHINDETLITALAEKVEELGIQNEEFFWYNDEYYVKDVCDPYEYSTWSEVKFSDGSDVVKGETNFFKCEPITWNIVDRSETDRRIIDCTNILDGHMFDSYSNNYSTSALKAWINDAFYTKAFFLNNSIIDPVELSNPNNTGDNVWVGSKDQLSSWYEEDSNRKKKISDFAISNKTMMAVNSDRNAYYWTRTPYDGVSNDVSYYVHSDGTIKSMKVSNDYVGISPDLKVKYYD